MGALRSLGPVNSSAAKIVLQLLIEADACGSKLKIAAQVTKNLTPFARQVLQDLNLRSSGYDPVPTQNVSRRKVS